MVSEPVISDPVISDEAVEQYREKGYIVVENVLSAERLAALRSKIDEVTERARGLTEGTEVFDLEEGHRPDAPQVQRVRLPHKVDPFFYEIAREPAIVEVLTRLLGPSVRLRNSKLNMKSSGGAAVEWHQDWAFYPHTNDDVLAVGVLVDDMTPDNGPLLLMPETHKGPLYDHHQDGYFVGAMDPERDGVDLGTAEPVLAPAGSISVHHARLLHGSDQNLSGEARRFLLFEYTAADAWPLAGGFSGFADWDSFNDQLVAGEPCDQPRMADVPVKLPFPPGADFRSIFQLQSTAKRGKVYAREGKAALEVAES